MANIRGLQLKAWKKTIGEEREGFQANLYFHKKKIGSIIDDGNGSPLCVNIEANAKKEVDETILDFYKSYPDFDLKDIHTFEEFIEQKEKGTLHKNNHSKDDLHTVYSNFFGKLANLHVLEKIYKKESKKGYPTMVRFQYDKIGNVWPLDDVYFVKDIHDIHDKIEQLEKFVQSPAYTTCMYTSLEDFVIL